MHRVADWFAQLNNKMGGDLAKIQTVGKVILYVASFLMLAYTPNRTEARVYNLLSAVYGGNMEGSRHGHEPSAVFKCI